MQDPHLMTVDRWVEEGFRDRHARVFLDGIDITNRCVWFNQKTGEAECFTTDPPTINWKTHEADRERLQGNIEIIAGVIH